MEGRKGANATGHRLMGDVASEGQAAVAKKVLNAPKAEVFLTFSTHSIRNKGMNERRFRGARIHLA